MEPQVWPERETVLSEARDHLRNARKDPNADFRSHQARVIADLVEPSRSGQSTLYIDRTGAGKSSTYFIAIKFLRRNCREKGNGPAVILSPLVSLVNDQIRAAKTFGLTARKWSAEMPKQDKDAVWNELKENVVDVLFLTPEMIMMGNFKESVTQFKPDHRRSGRVWYQVPLLVFDEAHCISDYGHDFRPYYLKCFDYLKKLPWWTTCNKLSTTATCNLRVMSELQALFGMNLAIHRGSLDRPNIELRHVSGIMQDEGHCRDWLIDFLTSRWNGKDPILVFCRLKSEVNACATLTRQRCPNARVGVYYADNNLPREKIEQQFKEGQIDILFSTLALGLGFDKSDLRVVVHMYTPSSPLQYYQEIGRAGRDEKSAIAYLLPMKPWCNVVEVRAALTRLMMVLRNKPEIEREAAEGIVRSSDGGKLNPRDITEAVELAIRKGYVAEEGTALKLLDGAVERDDEYVVWRTKETEFMKAFALTSASCRWQLLLKILGQEDAKACLTRCTFCDPQGVLQLSLDPMAVESRIYKKLTPGGRSVYAQKKNSSQIAPNPHLWKRIIEKCIDMVANDPASWGIFFIPGGQGANQRAAQALGELLELPVHPAAQVLPDGGRVTGVYDRSKRLEILAKKIRLPAEVPYLNVLLYDDALRSGDTFDFVADHFAKLVPKAKVVGLVDTIWAGQGADELGIENITV